MITIQRNSLWYNLAAFPDGEVSEPKNLCAFFWKTVLNVGLWLFLGGFLGTGIGAYGATLATHTLTTIVTSVICVGLVAFAWNFDDIKDWFHANSKEEKQSLLKEYFKAYKEKHCPLITFERHVSDLDEN